MEYAEKQAPGKINTIGHIHNVSTLFGNCSYLAFFSVSDHAFILMFAVRPFLL